MRKRRESLVQEKYQKAPEVMTKKGRGIGRGIGRGWSMVTGGKPADPTNLGTRIITYSGGVPRRMRHTIFKGNDKEKRGEEEGVGGGLIRQKGKDDDMDTTMNIMVRIIVSIQCTPTHPRSRPTLWRTWRGALGR